MPETDVLLLPFPAQENFPFLNDSREIHKAPIEIFDLDVALMKLEQETFDLDERPNPSVDHRTPDVYTWRHQFTQTSVVLLHFIPKLDQPFEPLTNPGKQSPSLVAGVMVLKPHLVL